MKLYVGEAALSTILLWGRFYTTAYLYSSTNTSSRVVARLGIYF